MDNQLFIAFIGWFLGIVSTLFVSSFQKFRKKEEVKVGISTEIRDLQRRQASSLYYFMIRQGKLTRDHIRLINSVYMGYEGDAIMERLKESYLGMAELSDESLKKLNEIAQPEEGKGVAVKHIDIPYTNSKISELSLFPENYQAQIFELLNHLRIYNEIVDEAQYYFRLSYDSSVIQENQLRANHEGERCYGKLGDRSFHIVHCIETLLRENI